MIFPLRKGPSGPPVKASDALGGPTGLIGSETAFTRTIASQNTLFVLDDVLLVLFPGAIDFDSPNPGELRYVGAVPIRAILAANFSLRDEDNNTVDVKVAITKNFVQVGFATLFDTKDKPKAGGVDTYADLAPGDILRMAAANMTNTDSLVFPSAHLLAAKQ